MNTFIRVDLRQLKEQESLQQTANLNTRNNHFIENKKTRRKKKRKKKENVLGTKSVWAYIKFDKTSL